MLSLFFLFLSTCYSFFKRILYPFLLLSSTFFGHVNSPESFLLEERFLVSTINFLHHRQCCLPSIANFIDIILDTCTISTLFVRGFSLLVKLTVVRIVLLCLNLTCAHNQTIACSHSILERAASSGIPAGASATAIRNCSHVLKHVFLLYI